MTDDDHEVRPSEDGGGASQNEARKRFPTVGIGTSAGGVHALQMFFESLPDDVDAAFVVVVHLDPGRQSELSNILAARTKMPVTQVSGLTPIEPRHVYVIPPNRQLRATDHHLAITEFDEPRWKRTPIDLFFRSLASQGGDDFAIVLTGAGSDGPSASKRSRKRAASSWSRIRTRPSMDRCPGAPSRRVLRISFCRCARSRPDFLT
jgi:chemotaxis response regulator CheB